MTMPPRAGLLQFHLECLQGMYFSELHVDPGGWLAFSDKINDPYYNVLVPTENAPLDWRDVRDEFARRGRIPTVYDAFDNGALGTNGHVWARDAWMITATADVATADVAAEPKADDTTLTLAGVKERDIYVGAFERAYSGDDPTEPYGELDPAYLDCLSDSFEQEAPPGRGNGISTALLHYAAKLALRDSEIPGPPSRPRCLMITASV